MSITSDGSIRIYSYEHGTATFSEKQFIQILDGINRGSGFDIKVDYSNTILNNTILNSDNEAAKHKILDLIGDMSLLGIKIRGHLIAYKSGHQSNVEFAKYLRKNYLDNEINNKK